MKVKMLKTGEQKDVNNSYGTRLIEQGQAVAVPEAKEEPVSTAGKRVKKGDDSDLNLKV